MALPSGGVDSAQKASKVNSEIEPQATPEFTITLHLLGKLAAVTDSLTAVVRVSGGA
jgi:hypothetical protein